MNDVRVSKLLSLVLRHRPDRIGLQLDDAGWVAVDELIARLNEHGHPVDRATLERVVATSDKQRFAIDRDADRIRANQGHSVKVDLQHAPATPPDVLFHGTPTHNLESIIATGLRAGQRHAVHLSSDEQTAHRVGARRGQHVVLIVDARRMHDDGYEFTVSDNGVWLTASVPAIYLRASEK